MEGLGPFTVSVSVVTIAIPSEIYNSKVNLTVPMLNAIWLQEQTLCNALTPLASGKKQTGPCCHLTLVSIVSAAAVNRTVPQL